MTHNCANYILMSHKCLQLQIFQQPLHSVTQRKVINANSANDGIKQQVLLDTGKDGALWWSTDVCPCEFHL